MLDFESEMYDEDDLEQELEQTKRPEMIIKIAKITADSAEFTDYDRLETIDLVSVFSPHNFFQKN